MTVDEYVTAVEARIESEDLQVWVVVDLRLNCKFVRRRGAVLPTDEYLLNYLGKPWHGHVVRWGSTKQITKKRATQVEQARFLF